MPSVGKTLRKLTARQVDSYNPRPSLIIVSDTCFDLVSDYRSKTVTTGNVGKGDRK